ncbi:MAG: hypothetical protein HGB21_16335 [Nitrospirae bacterium]|nr:hypothetical protein [Nitrospirota bacterium]
MRRLLGEILVESGLSPERLKKALELQKKRGGRIGTLLIRLNFLTEAEVLDSLKGRLAKYKVPRSVVFADQLPRNAVRMQAADANGSGNVNIADAVYLFSFLFIGGQPPPWPYPECGAAPAPLPRTRTVSTAAGA